MIVPDYDTLARIVAARQAQGERIVFTNGVFDILHVGHLRYLQEARAQGDALIVAVNADSGVRKLKGQTRPIIGENERAELLDGLRCVDYVTLFDTPTPVPVIEKVRPAIYVKGGDYRAEDLPEAKVVLAYGGEARVLLLVPGRSTTSIVQTILQGNGNDPPRLPKREE